VRLFSLLGNMEGIFKAVGWGYYGTELEVCDAESNMNNKET